MQKLKRGCDKARNEFYWVAPPASKQYSWEAPRLAPYQCELDREPTRSTSGLDSVTNRTNRIISLGNGVVPQMAEKAWLTLWDDIATYYNEITNYIQEVIEREQADEAEPWLMYGKLIDDIEVKDLTLYHIHLLDGLDNTILSGGKIDEANIAQFLWVISKDFELSNNKARDKFIKSIADKNTYKLRLEINDYIKSGLAHSRAMANGEKDQRSNDILSLMSYILWLVLTAGVLNISYIYQLISCISS